MCAVICTAEDCPSDTSEGEVVSHVVSEDHTI